MDVPTILAQARDAMTVKKVFGDPIERDGVMIIPVAAIYGGGGGGEGTGPTRDGSQMSTGGGVGFGLAATPLGVYVIKDGTVRWQPALDVNRLLVAVGTMALGAMRFGFLFRRMGGGNMRAWRRGLRRRQGRMLPAPARR